MSPDSHHGGRDAIYDNWAKQPGSICQICTSSVGTCDVLRSRPQSSIGLSSRVTRLGSLSATLLRLLSVPIELTEAFVGKLDKLPRPGLRVYRAPAERGIEPRFSNVLVGAGVGVGVGEPSEAVSSGGGGLDDSEEAVTALAGIEVGE